MLARTQLIFYIILLIICAISLNEVDNNGKCDAAEEFKTYEVTFVYKSNIDFRQSIQIAANDKNIGTCFLIPLGCDNNSPRYYNISIHELDGKRMVILTMRNLSRNEYTDSLWFTSSLSNSLIDTGHYCEPRIFSKPMGMSCESKVSAKGLNVTCLTQRIYPRGRCNVQIYHNLTRLYLEAGHILERNDVLQGTPRYYRTECTTLLEKSSLRPGKYEIQGTMFPNVTDEDTDIVYGTSYYLALTLENPSVTLENCPHEVKEATDVNCTCIRESNNDDSVHIRWYNSSHQVIESGPTLTIYAQSHRLGISVFCQAINILGWTSSQVAYTPYILSKAKNLTCNNVISNSGVQVTCTGYTIYDKGICHFTISINENLLDINRKQDSYAEVPGNSSFYTTKCSIFLPTKKHRPGMYEVNLTVYPNATNVDHYAGTQATHTFFLESPSVQLEDCPQTVMVEDTVVCTCTQKNTNSLPVDIQWYNSSGNILQTNTTTIHLQAKQIAKGAFCHGINIFGWKSNMLFYKPNVLSPCDKGKWGDTCQHSCSGHCLDPMSCHKDNGTCTGGCKEGYRGDTCEEDMCTDDMLKGIGIGAGASIGFVIFIASAVFIFKLYRVRKRKALGHYSVPSRAHTDYPYELPLSETSAPANVKREEGVYETINS